jgi:hypothetical protein
MCLWGEGGNENLGGVYITRESIKESTVRVSAGLHNTYVCVTRQAKNVENITRQWPNDHPTSDMGKKNEKEIYQ